MKKHRILLILPVIIVSGLIFYLSNQTDVPILNEAPIGFDKVLHFIAFFVYSIASLLFFVGIFKNKRTTIIKIFAILLSLIFAFSDEYHQSMVNGRDASIYDFIADALGIFISVFFYNYILKKIHKFNERFFSTPKKRQ